MDLFNLLKEIKKIEPDKDFTLKSRSLILRESEPAAKIWQFVLSNIELASSFALMVVVIYVMLGGFSSWKFSAPLRVSNLDPAGLQAEAQAIDIQIELVNLNYQDGSPNSLKLSESTTVSAPENTGSKSASRGRSLVSQKQNTATSSEPSRENLSVDAALEKLSE